MKRDILFAVEALRTYFPIRKGIFRRVAGHVRAVDGVDLTVACSETLGLVGESGCGKTTLGRSLLRLVAPTSGRIRYRLDGRMLGIDELSRAQMHRFRSQAQIVFQNPYGSLNPTKTVFQTLDEPLKVFGMRLRQQRQDRIAELLQAVNLRPEYMTRYPHQFSGGQRQRIALARSLTVDPIFLLCDEPVSALDVSVQIQVLNLLRRIQRERRLTMVFIAHDLKVVEYVSDMVAVMYLGKIVERFPADVLSRAVHPYTRALISAIPVADPARRGVKTILTGEVPDPANPPPGCRFHPRCPLRQTILSGRVQADGQRCVDEEPRWRQVAQGHRAACHHYEHQGDPA